MKPIFPILCLGIVCLCGCVQPTRTTGFFQQQQRSALPDSIPHRVAVFISGRPALAGQATELFSTGLTELGFDVVERNKISVLKDEIELGAQGYVTPETAIEKGHFEGADGIFVGSASGERAPTWTDTHLAIRLVQAKTGKTIWSVNANDPRMFALSMAEETSIIYTTKAAISALKKDIDKLR